MQNELSCQRLVEVALAYAKAGGEPQAVTPQFSSHRAATLWLWADPKINWAWLQLGVLPCPPHAVPGSAKASGASQHPCPVCPCRLPHRGPLGHDGRAHRGHKAGADLQRPGQQGEPGSCVCHRQEPHPGEAAAPRGRASGRRGKPPPWCHGHFPAPAHTGGECPRLGPGTVRCQASGRKRIKQPWEGISAVPSSQPSRPLSALQVSVMSYSAKFASCFYGPFRWVCPSARCAQAGPGWLGGCAR